MTTPIACPFTVLIDNREQHPWSFRGLAANADKGSVPLVVNCKSATLLTGDYSIEGFERHICIERKSLSDAFSTFTHDRERWERELERMRSIQSCHVVIEGGWQALAMGPEKLGGANIGKAVVRSIMAWSIRYPNVHWWPMPSREMAEHVAFRILEKFWEEQEWASKQLNKLSLINTSSSSRTSKSSADKSSAKGKSSLFPK